MISKYRVVSKGDVNWIEENKGTRVEEWVILELDKKKLQFWVDMLCDNRYYPSGSVDKPSVNALTKYIRYELSEETTRVMNTYDKYGEIVTQCDSQYIPPSQVFILQWVLVVAMAILLLSALVNS